MSPFAPRRRIAAAFLIVGLGGSVTWMARAEAPATAPTLAPTAGAQQPNPDLTKILQDAQTAADSGHFDVAISQLKNAVQLAPENGAIRGELGLLLARTGNAAEAERAIRQAIQDGASPSHLMPGLLTAMIELREFRGILEEFPEPKENTSANIVAILRARALALEQAGRHAEAKAAMGRSLTIKRDLPGLVTAARLALTQHDLTAAAAYANEASAKDPKDINGQLVKIEVLREIGDKPAALALTENLLKTTPDDLTLHLSRLNLLVDLHKNDDARKEADELLAKQPTLAPALFFRAMQQAQDKNFDEAWRTAQGLPPEFIQSDPAIAVRVASIAADAGNLDSANTIVTALIISHPAVDEPEIANARKLAAFIHLRQNKPQEAADVLDPLKDSKDPGVVGLLAQAALSLRHFDDAIKFLEAGKVDPSVQRELALAELAAGKTDEGIQQLRDLCQKDPTSPVYPGLLVSALSRVGRFDEAYAVVQQLQQKMGKSPYPSYYKGQLLAQEGKFGEAVDALSQALAADPGFIPARYTRASVFIDEREFSSASDDLDGILKADPTNLPAFLRKADIAARENKPAEVEQIVNAAITAAPKSPEPRLALAKYQFANKKYDDALATTAALLDAFPDNLDAIDLSGQIQSAKGQKEEAVATFKHLIDKAPDLFVAKLHLAVALIDAGDKGAAVNLLQEAVGRDPTNVEARRALIQLRVQNQQSDMALATAKDFTAKSPGTDADLLYADTLLSLKRLDEAKTVLKQGFVAHPDPRIVVRLAQTEQSQGALKNAEATLDAWLGRHPKDAAVRASYAEIFMLEGREKEASDQYEQVLQEHPNDVMAMNNLSWLLRSDEPNRAISLASRALKLAPDQPDIMDTLAWIEFGRGDTKEALSLLDRAYSLDQNSPTIEYHLAAALAQAGDKERAKELLQKAIASSDPFLERDQAKELAASLH